MPCLFAKLPLVLLLAGGDLRILGWASVFCRTRHLSRLNEDSPDITHLAAHFERFFELRNVFCIRQFLSGW